MPLHLSLNLSEFGRHAGAWRHPESDVTRMPPLDVYREAAIAAERGVFDQVFIADTPVHNRGFTGVALTRLDPFELAADLAAVTERVGIITTISTSYNDPVDVARRAASTSHLLEGRLGVNYVASSGDDIARNFGRDEQLPHDERYARSNEFLDAVTRIWEASPTVDEPARRVDFTGDFFDVHTTPDVERPAGGRPIVVQAGASPEGRDLAARWADAIYAGGSTIERAQEYYADIKKRAAGYGRDPDSIKIILGIMPFLGQTREEAQELRDTLDELHAEGADMIGYLSAQLEYDLSAHDPDGPLPFDRLEGVTRASVSTFTLFTRMAREENLTIRQIARRSYVGGLGNMQFVATGTGADIADVMEDWYRAETCDGFAIVAPILPRTIHDFVDLVVPELQRRGLTRRTYEGATLADHLGLTTPTSGAQQ